MTTNRFDVVCASDPVGGGYSMKTCTGHGHNIDTGIGIGWDDTYMYHYQGDTYINESRLSDYGITSALAQRVTNLKNQTFGTDYAIFGYKPNLSFKMSFKGGISFSLTATSVITGWTGQATPAQGWYNFKEISATEALNLETSQMTPATQLVLAAMAIGVFLALVLVGGEAAGAIAVLEGLLQVAGA